MAMLPTQQVTFMEEALLLAQEAFRCGEVPVGAVVVWQGEIVGRGRNRCEATHCGTAHAEMEAITQASTTLGRWRLEDCTLFVTLEPCAMCTGGIINSRVGTLYYGAREEKTGCCGSVLDLFWEPLGHKPKVYGGLLAQECKDLLTAFFQGVRNQPEHVKGQKNENRGTSAP